MDMKLGIALGRFRKPSLGALPVVLNQPTTLQVTEASGGRKLTWTNNSEYHTGTYVYRAPTLDPQNLPTPVATVGPVAQGATAEWIDDSGEYGCFAVQDYDGQGVGTLSAEVCVANPLASAQIGDYVQGGVYAGIYTLNSADYHIIFSEQSGEVGGTPWKTSNTFTEGTLEQVDGVANTQAMIDAGIDQHPAAKHCVNYSGGGYDDWYLPSGSELALESRLRGHPEFSTLTRDYRWESNGSSGNAVCRRFSDGARYSSASKTTTSYTRVRPVRRVPA